MRVRDGSRDLPAEVTLDALRAGRFLALHHPDVVERFLAKATDYDGWLAVTAATQHPGDR